MEKNHVKDGKALGAELTIEKVEEYLKKDVSVAISCLNAIYADPDLLRSMATWMHGRWQNHKKVGDSFDKVLSGSPEIVS